MNIMYIQFFKIFPLRMNIFFFLSLLLLNVIMAQTKSISFSGNYTKANHPSVLTTNGHINTDSLIQYLTNSGSKTYTWRIDQNNSWEDLKNSLPELKIAGISITVSLMPPTNSSPSEPFGLDFIMWAKEIANLSLRYSNLKGYQLKIFKKM